jgi:hypothetical protein
VRPRLTLKLARKIPGEPFRLPDEAVERLIDACRPDVDWLARTLGRDPFFGGGRPAASLQAKAAFPATAETARSAPSRTSRSR